MFLLTTLFTLGIGLFARASDMQVQIEGTEDACVSPEGTVEFICTASISAGDMQWYRIRSGTTDWLTSNSIVIVAQYGLTYDDSNPERISTLIVDKDIVDRNKDIYYCDVGGIPSGQSTLREQDTSCSWCSEVETSGLCNFLKINGEDLTDCDDLVIKTSDGVLHAELDLSTDDSQQFEMNGSIILSNETITVSQPWNCSSSSYSPLILEATGLTSNVDFSIVFSINHPSFNDAGTDLDIRGQVVIEPDTDGCETICIIIIICVCGGTIIVVIIIIVKRKALKRCFCKDNGKTESTPPPISNRVGSAASATGVKVGTVGFNNDAAEFSEGPVVTPPLKPSSEKSYDRVHPSPQA